MRESVQLIILQLTPVTFPSHSHHDAESEGMIVKETKGVQRANLPG